MKLNQEQVDQALRQIGIIVTVTGLITGLLDLAQLPAGAVKMLTTQFERNPQQRFELTPD